jgi:twitching motility two-component system response regulator PilG
MLKPAGNSGQPVAGPARPTRLGQQARSQVYPMEHAAQIAPKSRLSGLKVLVIDDSKTIRRTAETLLSKEGCEVFTAVDGFDALSKIADHQPDIVFVDIMMPRLDGYQTCSLIKHNKVFRSIPVIMLSSKDGLFDRARGRIVGSEHYLTKPFTRDELLSAIAQHVAATEAAAS